MLSKCKEEDFDQIKSVALDRLSPNNISGASWGFFIYGLVTTIVSFASIDSDVSLFMALLITGSILLFVIQLVFTLLFTIKTVAYKFQKLHSVFLSFIGFKLSVDTYQSFFGISESFNSPRYIFYAGVILLIGGIISLILSTFRSIKRVKQGELRREGKGLYDFQNSKGFVSVPIIFGVTMLGGAAGRIFSDISSDITVLIILFIAVILQYGIALALPEFYLLTYCKFRFDSFKVKRPDSRMRGSKR